MDPKRSSTSSTRMSRPLAVETVPQAVVDLEGQARAQGHRAGRVGRPHERARRDRAQRHLAKQLAERRGLGLTGLGERYVELSSENTGGVERRLAVTDQEDMDRCHDASAYASNRPES